jgi:hypothetical protein
MRVKNINVTSDSNCQCGTWIKHWEKHSEQTPNYCLQWSCTEKKELVGARVQKVVSNDESWYIIPLCKKHHSLQSEFEIIDGSVLVPVNKNYSCEK